MADVKEMILPVVTRFVSLVDMEDGVVGGAAHNGGKYPGGHRHIANLPKSTQVPPFRHGSSRSQKGFNNSQFSPS